MKGYGPQISRGETGGEGRGGDERDGRLGETPAKLLRGIHYAERGGSERQIGLIDRDREREREEEVIWESNLVFVVTDSDVFDT